MTSFLRLIDPKLMTLTVFDLWILLVSFVVILLIRLYFPDLLELVVLHLSLSTGPAGLPRPSHGVFGIWISCGPRPDPG